MYKVVEIFMSIEGEGKRMGLPTTFIRLYGCNLNCSYCDTRYACENKEYVEMDLYEILGTVRRFNVNNVTITGGEPLIQEDIVELVYMLAKEGFDINIETNGSVKIPSELRFFENVFFTVDYKSPSSGMEEEMILQDLNKRDVLKFVVSDEKDLLKMAEKLNKTYYTKKENIFVSPVFGKISPTTIAEFIMKYNLDYVKVQVQLHKILWDPNKRGV
ncbi:MAG: radical SAM protein [Erysipelotrichaceae bacterium]|nr:radical SAM protein [Erysipelotrichaceae bacterium]